MTARIAYLGDTSLDTAAGYLAGVMTHFGFDYEYVPSDATPPESVFDDDTGLYILSDYPSERLTGDDADRLVAAVGAGAGLCMLGGWESYHGLGGDWDAHAVADLLPVRMRNCDDRVNYDQVVVVVPVAEHPVLDGLPFESPPCIGGYNDFDARVGATVVLEGRRHRIAQRSGRVDFLEDEAFPLLVVSEEADGPRGPGRRACLGTDAAPHWVGPFVDWGAERVSVDVPRGESVEVGDMYAAFFRNLLAWCLGDA